MEIDIKEILAWGASIPHVILRNGGDVSGLKDGCDIDILTNNEAALAHLYITGLLKYAHLTYTIKKTNDAGHTHIDVLRGNKLVVRFDIIDDMPLLGSKNLVEYIIMNKKNINDLSVPSAECEVFTRMLEYFNNPDKIKHIEYAKSHCI